MNSFKELFTESTKIKVGDTVTKDGKKGKIIKISGDMAQVDFGNGDVYGIVLRRINPKTKIISEKVGILVDLSPYENAHGKKPKASDQGSWIWIIGDEDTDGKSEKLEVKKTSFSKAKPQAVKKAKQLGVENITLQG
jgi:hypothetical protein